jgi:YidC/Oxa1 family membrane protein insertase
MDKRFMVFMLLAALLLLGNMLLVQWLAPPPKPGPLPLAKDDLSGKQAGEKGTDEAGRAGFPIAAPDPQEESPVGAAERVPEQLFTLGSADPQSPYRMLVTLTTRGAALVRAELNNPRYQDEESLLARRGYLGRLEVAPAPGGTGVVAKVVGAGTPAARGGLKPGDVLLSGETGKGEKTVFASPADFERFMEQRRVGETIKLWRQWGGTAAGPVTVKLTAAPMEIIRPVSIDPHSLLLTVAKLGQDVQLVPNIGVEWGRAEEAEGALVKQIVPGGPAARAGLQTGDVIIAIDDNEIERPADVNDLLAQKIPAGGPVRVRFLRGDNERTEVVVLNAELPGIDLHTAHWKPSVNPAGNQIEFRHFVPSCKLEFVKRYTLPKIDPQKPAPADHLLLEIQIINRGDEPTTVSYQLDGPNGLPTDGWWYASKISRTWSGVGVRDVAYEFVDDGPELIGCHTIATNEAVAAVGTSPLRFVGVDGRYFAAALVPVPRDGEEGASWVQAVRPIRAGLPPLEKARVKLTNTTFRLTSVPTLIERNQKLHHSYSLFLGPKSPELLEQQPYGLSDMVYYGWFGWVSKPMLGILHFFHGLVGNYGLAIIMLTLLVRVCMFPLSKKQALNAQKMQELQPELKRIAEKYKKDFEARTRATQELFKKNKYNPYGGCLLLFVQLPVFVGLYRGLMIDVELFQAPLIPGLRWCGDLSAPDMLFRWRSFMPDFLASETGWLGPYFNILPIVTIALFLVHQKLFMPPPTDEQQVMQHRLMKWMMVFMGFMFFCVPSGLCLYFITSSLWGIAERKLIPKVVQAQTEGPARPLAEGKRAAASGNGAAGDKQKPPAKRV